MAIAKKLKESIQGSSMIRKMFEEGALRAKKFGADKVFDFSIGNPIFEPPHKVQQALAALATSDETGMHRYMPNQGYAETRAWVAKGLTEQSGLKIEMNSIIMTCGAGGGLNVALKCLLDDQDEVIVFTPYFVEYDAYVDNHSGKIRRIAPGKDFNLNLDGLEEAIGPKTKAVIINSPNNPTGVVYPKQDLARLNQILLEAGKKFKRVITLISDEPYRRILYEGELPSILALVQNSCLITSASKDLALPGERIGYLAISPAHRDAQDFIDGAVLANRILGFVNAPAMMQRMLPKAGEALVDLEIYRNNRDLLCQALSEQGYNLIKPQGAFYLFPQSPLKDDMAFVQMAQQENLLLVPGRAFGTPGYFRIAFCFDTQRIQRSLPIFAKLAKACGVKG